MLDLNRLRRYCDDLKQRLEGRVEPTLLDEFVQADERRRAAVTEIEQLKRQRNEFSALVAQAKKSGEDASEAIAKSKEIGQRAKALEDAVKAAEEAQHLIATRIPNIPHESVPAGPDESANVEVLRWGTIKEYDFEPQAHWDIGPKLGILDFERAAKITGSRFVVYMASAVSAGFKLSNRW